MTTDTAKPDFTLGAIFLGRKRPGFDPAWGDDMTVKVRKALAERPFAVIEPEAKVVDIPSLRQAVDFLKCRGVDAILALQTTMADSRMAPTLSQLWPDPVLLWATPENPEGDMISSCSLVGAHNWASIYSQMGHPFAVVHGDPADSDTMRQLDEAARLAFAMRRLKRACVGVVGGQAPGYFAMAADPFSARRRLGVQSQMFSLIDFQNAVNDLDDEAVAADVVRFKALGVPHKDTTDEDLPMASRLYLAMKHFLDNEGLDALAVRCWPEMTSLFGQWPYVGMARLADEGYAISMEGDADGAICALLGDRLGMGRCYLSDWLEHDAETITIWHGGTAPFALTPAPGEPGGPRVARHFNVTKPAVIESTLTTGMPVTLFRLWRVGGQYKMTAAEGETIAPRRHLMGSNGLARLWDCDPREWFLELCEEGMPHHIAVFRGHHKALLKRFARKMGMQWVAV